MSNSVLKSRKYALFSGRQPKNYLVQKHICRAILKYKLTIISRRIFSKVIYFRTTRKKFGQLLYQPGMAEGGNLNGHSTRIAIILANEIRRNRGHFQQF